jgi:hypothetical protein
MGTAYGLIEARFLITVLPLMKLFLPAHLMKLPQSLLRQKKVLYIWPRLTLKTMPTWGLYMVRLMEKLNFS